MKLIDALIDDAMSVLAFDWDWKNESVPEVKTARDALRERFKKTLGKKSK